MWIIGIFFFVSLIFYKVMPIYVFAQDNTIVAAAMMAACSAIAMFGAQTLSIAPIMRWVSDPAEKYVTFPIRHTAPWFLLCGSGAVIADVFIVQGFASRLFRTVFVGRDAVENLFWFAVVALLPLLVHYAVFLMDLKKLKATLNSRH